VSLLTAVGWCLIGSLAVAFVLDFFAERRAKRRAVPPCGCGGDHRDPLPYPPADIPHQSTTTEGDPR
jgi:hypothetical protein